MPSNDNPITITQLSPRQAVDKLAVMVEQLKDVMHHFSEQEMVSASTKAKTLADMSDQLTAMEMGKTALEVALNDESAEAYDMTDRQN